MPTFGSSRLPAFGRSLVFLLCLSAAAPVSAQQPAPLSPSVPLWKPASGVAAVALPDGGFIVGGAFRHASGHRRSGLARFTAAGTVDESWSVPVDGTVTAMALVPGGDLVIGGDFATVDGTPRANLAKVDIATATLEDSWQADTDQPVRALLASPTGALFVGGGFTVVAGSNRTGLAKLDAATGVVAPSWNPGMTGGVSALALGSDGDILAGGPFYDIGGSTIDFLAKLDPDTAAVDLLWEPRPDNYITDLLADGQGSVYVSGFFFSGIGGQSIRRVAKLSDTGTGAAFPAWNPAPQSGNVQALGMAANGDIYVGGSFLTIGGQPIPLVARVDPVDGSVSAVLSSPPTGPVVNERLDLSVGFVLEIGGSLVIGARFQGGGGVENLGLGRFDLATGNALPPRQYLYAPTFPTAILAQANGGVVVAGEFTAAGEAPIARLGLLRLTSHGALDPYWRADVTGTYGYVFALAEGQDGSIYAGGSFTAIGGVARTYLAKLSAAGAVDPTWAPTSADSVYGLATGSGSVFAHSDIQTQDGLKPGVRRYSQSGTGNHPGNWTTTANDGSIAMVYQSAGLVVGGRFATIGGISRPMLARLDPATGQVDQTWTPTFSGATHVAPVLDLGGDLLVTGDFTHVNGTARRGLARLLPNASLDGAWNPSLPGAAAFEATAVALGAQQSLYMTGAYEDVGGEWVGVLSKLDADTATVDPAWNPQPDGSAYGVAVDARDAVHVIGTFQHIGGQPRTSLAALPGEDYAEVFHSSFE